MAHRTAQGRMIDIEKLRLQNEETIAVGNMGVNARGDKLGPNGEIVKTRNEIMKEHYSQIHQNVPTDGHIPQKAEADISQAEIVPTVREEIDLDDPDFEMGETLSDGDLAKQIAEED